MKNDTSGCIYICDFLGFAGGISAGISFDAGGWNSFTTPDGPVLANDFECDNQCAVVFSAGIGFLVGFSSGFIHFRNINTKDTNIDIGGFSFSPEKKPSFSIGVFGAEGRVRVLNKGHM